MATEIEVNKNNLDKFEIKRIELEYKDMNYIIVNLEEKVIDVNGDIWEFSLTVDDYKLIKSMTWEYKDLDEFDYWPDKTKDHPPMATLWRVSFYDEFDNYYHKSGVTDYPAKFMELVEVLKNLK